MHNLKDRIVHAISLSTLKDKEIASQLGVTPSYFSHLKNGHRTTNNKKLLNLLAKIVQCNPSWLINGEGEINQLQAPSQPIIGDDGGDIRQKLDQAQSVVKDFLSVLPVDQVVKMAKDALASGHIELAKMAVEEASRRELKEPDKNL